MKVTLIVKRPPVKHITPIRGRSSILDSVHSIETAQTGVSLKRCESPLCHKEFNPTCLPWQTQRYCSADCRQLCSLIKRVREKLEDLTDDEIVRVDPWLIRRYRGASALCAMRW